MKTKSENKFEFIHLDAEVLRDEKFEGEAIGFFKDAMLRFRKNRASVAAFIIILIIVVMSIFGPMINEYDYKQQNIQLALMPARIPVIEKLGIFDGVKTINVRKESIEEKYKDSLVKIVEEYKVRDVDMATIKVDMYKYKGVKDKYFWFGTDSLGRDQWTRLWRGSRISLIIAVLSMSVNIVVGVIYGAISGYYGGVVDLIMQRIIEVIGGIPLMVIVILFVLYDGPGIIPIAIALCLTGWIGMSRMIRAQFYKYKGMEYVLASRTLGATDRVLIFRHILPNAVGIIITMSALAIPSAIFSESFLAYIGLGLQAPEPSIGVLLSEGQQVLLEHPHLTIFPAFLISILMISFNLLGNGLRDAFDPTLRGQE